MEPALDIPAANRRGILGMLAAMTLFSVNDALLKLASATYPPGQIMAIRGLFACLTALALVGAMGELGRLKGLRSPRVLIRAGLEAGVAFLFISSVAKLPLANVTAILQATPIILTVMTVLLGLETIGWRRWSAILVGFGGVLLVVKPSAAGFNVYAGIALAAALLVAGRDLVTRFIGEGVPSVVVALSTTIAVALAGFLLAPNEDWRPFAPWDTLCLAAAAVMVTGGNLAVIVALRATDISVVAPFRYSIVLLSIAWGFLLFRDLPDRVSCLGIGMIVLSGVYTIHRQGARSRDAGEPIAAPLGEQPPAAGARR